MSKMPPVIIIALVLMICWIIAGPVAFWAISAYSPTAEDKLRNLANFASWSATWSPVMLSVGLAVLFSWIWEGPNKN